MNPATTVSTTAAAAGESMRAIEVARVCVWTADLPAVVPHHDALEADIDELLSHGGRNRAGYGEQTLTRLHQLAGSHWKRFFSEIRRVISDVVATSPAPVDQGTVHLRAWASRLRRDGDYSKRYLRLSALHNHSPAFLSAVYYLRVPPGVREGDGGTFFVNPFPHSLASPQPGMVIPPREGRVVVFPSWLMHGPALLDDPASQLPRLVIAVDAHLLPR